MLRRLTLALALTVPITGVFAQPAIVYDMGGKFDKSFNEAAWRGAERWKKDNGKAYLDFEIANEAQREQAMRRMAERGANPVMGIGFSQASSIEKVAKAFPKQQFVIVDSGQAAQRRIDRLQGARGQFPRRHHGRDGQQDRPDRFRPAAWTSR
jgi:basic membrane protein A